MARSCGVLVCRSAEPRLPPSQRCAVLPGANCPGIWNRVIVLGLWPAIGRELSGPTCYMPGMGRNSRTSMCPRAWCGDDPPALAGVLGLNRPGESRIRRWGRRRPRCHASAATVNRGRRWPSRPCPPRPSSPPFRLADLRRCRTSAQPPSVELCTAPETSSPTAPSTARFAPARRHERSSFRVQSPRSFGFVHARGGATVGVACSQPILGCARVAALHEGRTIGT